LRYDQDGTNERLEDDIGSEDFHEVPVEVAYFLHWPNECGVYVVGQRASLQGNQVWYQTSRVYVLDGVGDTLIKSVRVWGRAEFMAYCETLNKVYVQVNDDPIYEVAVIDAGPDTVLRRVGVSHVGQLMWHPVSNRLFCSMGYYDSAVAVLDCAADTVVAVRRVTMGPGAGTRSTTLRTSRAPSRCTR
jgi:hypothetical protein